MPSEFLSQILSRLQPDQMLAYVRNLTEHDRFQASLGIEKAAEIVAEAADASNVERVSIERFSADGTTAWWSFQAPLAWTPRVARLEIPGVFEIDHARHPFSIATYSAPTPAGGLSAYLVNIRPGQEFGNVKGAIAVLDSAAYAHADLLNQLAHAGAAGFVTDVSSRGGPSEAEHTGRVELPLRTSLFGFSVTSRQLDLVKAEALRKTRVHVTIEIDRLASMPVVTGVIPGLSSEAEVWLTAHLCHPRPGANDNASGVAALLGIAAALKSDPRYSHGPFRDRTIRFLWGPEFLGLAAVLHRQIGSRGKSALPSSVINLDMVGEDQSLCGGPFLVEHSPDYPLSPINALAEYVVGDVFDRTKRNGDIWRPTPFMGFSDHALFADPNLSCPAVQFCHSPDRFNHCSGDSLDKVSEIEMIRASAAAGTLAHVLATDHSKPAVEQIVQNWCAGEETSARRLANQFTGKYENWGRHYVDYIVQRNASLLLLTRGCHDIVPAKPQYSPTDQSGPPLFPCWAGPFNARAMMADLPGNTRSALQQFLQADKQNLSLLINLAIRANGTRNQEEIIQDASFGLRRPIDSKAGRQLMDALLQSGWLATTNKKANPV